MLAKVTDVAKGELENQYNGLGFRVASTRPEEKIEYLCDLSRDYYNLLERTVNGETESFIYDNNVISMSKAGSNYYYLQDELGSPMYMTGTDGVAVSSYAFDDFGRNIDPRTGKQRKHEYITNGNIIQPFAFTGYQEDEVSGLKFAQARFYDANTGRFQSEDNVKGFIDNPFTLNHYGYCWGNPVGVVDRDGNWPEWVENTVKVVTVVAAGVAIVGAAAAVAVAAPAAVVVGTGLAASATCAGVISGFVNEENGGSYTNGFIGGAIAGTVQYIGARIGGGVGNELGGAIGNALGANITNRLDNLDKTVSAKYTEEQITNNTLVSGIYGAAFSLPGTFMGHATSNVYTDLMPGYTQGMGEAINQFFGAIDNFFYDRRGVLCRI